MSVSTDLSLSNNLKFLIDTVFVIFRFAKVIASGKFVAMLMIELYTDVYLLHSNNPLVSFSDREVYVYIFRRVILNLRCMIVK